jgi:hypothetical protein
MVKSGDQHQEIVRHIGQLGIDHITFSFCKPYKQSVPCPECFSVAGERVDGMMMSFRWMHLMYMHISIYSILYVYVII